MCRGPGDGEHGRAVALVVATPAAAPALPHPLHTFRGAKLTPPRCAVLRCAVLQFLGYLMQGQAVGMLFVTHMVDRLVSFRRGSRVVPLLMPCLGGRALRRAARRARCVGRMLAGACCCGARWLLSPGLHRRPCTAAPPVHAGAGPLTPTPPSTHPPHLPPQCKIRQEGGQQTQHAVGLLAALCAQFCANQKTLMWCARNQYGGPMVVHAAEMALPAADAFKVGVSWGGAGLKFDVCVCLCVCFGGGGP